MMPLWKSPLIKIQDNTALPTNHVRVRHYADFLLDRDYNNSAVATEDIIRVLDRIALEHPNKRNV